MALQLPSLSSRDVDGFLLTYHGVPEEEREGYIQRLRNITRLGFPAGLSIGKGHPARYAADQFFQLVAVTELYRCRVPPKLAVKLVKGSWPDMQASILAVWERRDASEHGRLLADPRKFWRVPAEGGQRMFRTAEGAQLQDFERIAVVGREDIDELIDASDRLSHCHIFIDVSKLIEGVFDHLKWGGTLLSADKIALFMAGMGGAR